MTKISRHEISNRALVQERFDLYQDDVAYFWDVCSKDGDGFEFLWNNAPPAAANGSVLGGKHADIGRAIRLAADAGACMFAAVSTKPAELRLGNRRVSGAKRTDESLMYSSRWMDAFFLNCLCRNLDNLNLLCGVPLSVLKASSTVGQEFRAIFADAILRYWNDRDGVVKLLIEAMEKTDPDKYELVKPEWVLHLDVHQIKLFAEALNHDPNFGTTLKSALELHKAYWSKTEERRMDSDGFLAFNLLGLAAMAYDRSLPIDIDSEYLPMDLVDGSFLQAPW